MSLIAATRTIRDSIRSTWSSGSRRGNDWSFERASDDEITMLVTGQWTDYQVSFTWMDDIEALHLACAFDLKVPERRRAEVQELISLINEQLWVGHFDLWTKEGMVMFRHALVLAGGIEASGQQCQALLGTALDACERYFPAFQFVVWAGKGARRGARRRDVRDLGRGLARHRKTSLSPANGNSTQLGVPRFRPGVDRQVRASACRSKRSRRPCSGGLTGSSASRRDQMAQRRAAGFRARWRRGRGRPGRHCDTDRSRRPASSRRHCLGARA